MRAKRRNYVCGPRSYKKIPKEGHLEQYYYLKKVNSIYVDPEERNPLASDSPSRQVQNHHQGQMKKKRRMHPSLMGHFLETQEVWAEVVQHE